MKPEKMTDERRGDILRRLEEGRYDTSSWGNDVPWIEYDIEDLLSHIAAVEAERDEAERVVFRLHGARGDYDGCYRVICGKWVGGRWDPDHATIATEGNACPICVRVLGKEQP